MKATLHIEPGFDRLPTGNHHREWLGYFAEGLNRHGVAVRMREGFDPTDCDLAVFWSMNRRANAVVNKQRAEGKRFLVLERGFLGDRMKWTSIGFDGAGGTADYCNADSPHDRSQRFAMQDWQPGGEYVLLCGQVPTDASLRGLKYKEWLKQTLSRLEEHSPLPVRYRPHPIVQHPTQSLADALSGAACVVTYTSTCGVDAVIAGIPSVTLHEGSMAWGVSGHSIEDVLNPPTPDRSQWLADLAYTQWHKGEIKSGRAWEHLKRGLE